MIKFVSTSGDGRPLIGFGLSRGNIDHLIADKTMVVDLMEIMESRLRIAIFFRETEADMMALLEDGKMLSGVAPGHSFSVAGLTDIADEAIEAAMRTIRDARGHTIKRDDFIYYMKTFFQGITPTGKVEYRKRLIALAGVILAAVAAHDKGGK